MLLPGVPLADVVVQHSEVGTMELIDLARYVWLAFAAFFVCLLAGIALTAAVSGS